MDQKLFQQPVQSFPLPDLLPFTYHLLLLSGTLPGLGCVSYAQVVGPVVMPEYSGSAVTAAA